MDTQDLDEAERLRRKNDVVAWREKKRFSRNFIFIATILEIIETLAIMLILFLLSSVVFFKICNPENQTVQMFYQCSLILIFIVGLVAGFIIYKKVMKYVIEKFELQDKLTEDVLMHYVKKSKEEAEEEMKR